MSGEHSVASTTVTYELSPISKTELPLLIICIIILAVAVRRSKANSLIWLLVGMLLIGVRMAIQMAQVHFQPQSYFYSHVARSLSLVGIAGWISITWYCWKVFHDAWSNKKL